MFFQRDLSLSPAFFFTFPWWMTIRVSAVSSGLAASMSERTAETCV